MLLLNSLHIVNAVVLSNFNRTKVTQSISFITSQKPLSDHKEFKFNTFCVAHQITSYSGSQAHDMKGNGIDANASYVERTL